MPEQVVQKPVKPVVTQDAVKAGSVVSKAGPVVAESTSIWKKWWLWLIVILVIAGLIIWIVI